MADTLEREVTVDLRVDGQFEKIAQEILEQYKKKSKAILGQEGRPFQDFNPVAEEVNPHSIAEIRDLFRGEDAETVYVKIVSGNADGINGRLAAHLARMNADFLSGWHRDFTARTRSRIRTIAQQADRFEVFGEPTGPLGSTTITQSQDLMREVSGVSN